MVLYIVSFGIVALLLVGGVMIVLSMNDKNDKPSKIEIAPNASDAEQVNPKPPEEEAPVASTPYGDLSMPVFREDVIVYFKEMPVSLEEFASKYGVKPIFAKQNIKMAAFETKSIGEPGKTSQSTVDFINQVSKESHVEKGCISYHQV